MSKNKRKVVKVVASVMVGIMAFGGATWYAIQSLFKKESAPTNSHSITSTDLSDLGTELNNKESKKTKDKKSQKNNGYTESKGKLYVDEESAKNADKVGSSVIDTQDGKLTVDSDGKVKDKETGYEVKDEQGNIIDSGNENSDGTIDGFEKDEELGNIYEKEDNTSDFVIADSNYYDSEGNLIISQGELIEKSSLDWAKQNLSTTKPVQQQVEPEVAPTSVASTSASRAGTYTDSYGNEWNSYQDYLNGINNFDGVYMGSNGLLYGTEFSNEDVENYQKTK